jgi:hypothetical protein
MFFQGNRGMRPGVTTEVKNRETLIVTINGAARTIVPKGASLAWVLKDGKTVVYSFRDLKRGYEGEGEVLFRYDTATGKRTRILTADVMIDKIYELTTARGKSLLCVTMSDGGLGANHVALVHPERGEVFGRPMSRFVKIEPDQIVVAEWGNADLWHGAENPRGKPTRYFTFVPDRILNQRAVAERPWSGR